MSATEEQKKAYEKSKLTTLKRMPARASYDQAVVHAILDEALIVHVAYQFEGKSFCMPQAFARLGQTLFMHGSITNRMLKTMKGGIDVCVTATLVDALVLARSGFHHDICSRSVMAFGTAHAVTDPDEKLAALDAIVDHICPGRARDLQEHRVPSGSEMNATAVLALPLQEVSAKLRTGNTEDEKYDLDLDLWAGVLPLRQDVPQRTIDAEDLPARLQGKVPQYVLDFDRKAKAAAAAAEA